MRFLLSILFATTLLTLSTQSANALWWSNTDPRVNNIGFSWNGPGVPGGVNEATNLDTGGTTDFRQRVIDILNRIIELLGILCVVILVIGGLMLVAGMGSDDSREKVRKIVLYTIVGLILVLFAKAVVDFYTDIVLT